MPNVPETDATVTRLRAAEQAVLRDLTDMTDGVALCRVPGSAPGASGYPTVKYLEGAAAALAEARRRASSGEPEATAAIAHTLAQWRARAEVAAGLAESWEAYYAGGIEALERADA